jgi:hypothetical protein
MLPMAPIFTLFPMNGDVFPKGANSPTFLWETVSPDWQTARGLRDDDIGRRSGNKMVPNPVIPEGAISGRARIAARWPSQLRASVVAHGRLDVKQRPLDRPGRAFRWGILFLIVDRLTSFLARSDS